MVHIAIGIQIFSYSLSTVTLALLLILWIRTREPGLLALVGIIASFTALLIVNFLVLYTGNTAFQVMNVFISIVMIYDVPRFSVTLIGVGFWKRRYGRILLPWVGLLAVGLIVYQTTAALPFIYGIIYASLGVSIVVTTVGVIIIVRERLRYDPEYHMFWYARVSLNMAYLALPFLPGFVVFDFPHDFVLGTVFTDVVQTFSAVHIYLMIWNILLLKRALPELAKSGISGEDERIDAWIGRFSLSPRESEVCRLLAKGDNYEQIEERLFISRSTLKTHTNRIYRKTKTKNQVDLMKKASGPS